MWQMSLQCFIWGGKELKIKTWNYWNVWTCHAGLQGEPRMKISYTCSCLLHNTMAYSWLWQYHDKWKEESGLTGMHLELIHHPVNYKVPQNIWLQFLPKLTGREAWYLPALQTDSSVLVIQECLLGLCTHVLIQKSAVAREWCVHEYI